MIDAADKTQHVHTYTATFYIKLYKCGSSKYYINLHTYPHFKIMRVCVVRHLGDAYDQATVTLSVLKITNGKQMMELYSYPLKMTSPRSKYISPRIADSSDDLPDPVVPTTIINFPVLTRT